MFFKYLTSLRANYFFIFLFLLSFTQVDAQNPQEKHVIGTWAGVGLFAMFNNVLNHIRWCQDNNKTPVVYWDAVSLYYLEQGFNGSKNVWEYYFEPISSQTYEPTDVIERYCLDQTYGFNYFGIEQAQRDQAHVLINKYIKIKPNVLQKVDSFYQQHMVGKKIIAIHLRATDKGVEEAIVAPERMVAQALKYADAHTYFFIASDDQRVLNRMNAALPKGRVIYYNCYRSGDGKPLHQPLRNQSSHGSQSDGKPSFAQLGEDVLIEVLLLARCNMLIHTYSNVSTVALYFNPVMKNVLIR